MNRRIARLTGVGIAMSALAAVGLLGVSSARGDQWDALAGTEVATSGPAFACTGIGDADRALRAGCVQERGLFRAASWTGGRYGEEYEAYEDYLHTRDRYEHDTGRYDFDRRHGEHDRDRSDRRDRDHDRHHHRDETDAWVDGNYFGLSPYQDSWVAGLIEGSDWGRDFVIPYSHPGHPLANFPRVPTDPSYRCAGPGAPYRCLQEGPGGPVAPGAPVPGAPGVPAPGAPAPGSPSTPGPGGPAATSAPPPGTSRPNTPTTTRPLVPPASTRPSRPGQALGGEDSGLSVVTLLLVFLASAGSVGAAYLMLRRRENNPLSGP